MHTEEIYLNLGPQHPSTHGVLKLLLQMEGERVVRCTPVLGQLHRGIEKMAEELNYTQFTPLTDRLDYLASANNNLAYILTVEKMLGIEAPERAQYIRVIVAELQRIASHLVALGSMALDLGAWTMMLYPFREREMILDLFEEFCGARLTLNCFRVGGTSYDFSAKFIAGLEEFIRVFPAKIKDYEGLLNKNPIWLGRTRDVGVVSAADAVAYGLTGPNLRASGVKWDLRRERPYLLYDRFQFDVPVGDRGDAYDRYYVKVIEMAESLKIVEQALKELPRGPIMIEDPNYALPDRNQFPSNFPSVAQHFHYVVKGLAPQEQEIYCGFENPKGELGFFIVSDGSGHPYRLKIRAPSFISLSILPKILEGVLLQDVISVLASFDPVMGEIDR